MGFNVARSRRGLEPTLTSTSRSEDENKPLLLLLIVSLVGSLAWGWLQRTDGVLTPGRGAGYALGIVGALMMLVLLLYPLRKRIGFMRSWGPASFWFRWHMILGVVGPTLIVLHSDFDLHSTNATVAFASMLTVAGSGVAGRYLYGRIHRGLYGQRLEAKGLRDEAVRSRDRLAGDLSGSSRWVADLSTFEAAALSPTPTLGAALARAFLIGGMIRRSRKAIAGRIDDELTSEGRMRGWNPQALRERRRDEMAQLRSYYSAVRRAATLGVYERLFALWHVLHVPLFIILVLTAIIHVVAVHLY